MVIRGKGGGGGWEHLKALQRTSPSGTSSSLRTIPDSLSFFFLCQALTAPFGFEVHRILVPIGQISRHLTAVRPRDYCEYFTIGEINVITNCSQKLIRLRHQGLGKYFLYKK